ncbi:hypothetical protein AU194_20405 [Mycobacterium sp. GA-2829]|nr:hypothetical protein AU194_20405 [Mycobacterium sp. GA-2829]
MSPAGDIIPFRSDYTGVSIPFGGELVYFRAAGWIAPVYPQLAQTLWAIACYEILKIHSGGVEEYLAKPFPLDAGNYRSTGLFARAIILLAAREFGDTQIADAAERAMLAHNDAVEIYGMRRFTKGSTYANALAAQALLTRRGDWKRLITSPPAESALNGPLLKHVRLDQATVAQAISSGSDLRLVLHGTPELTPTDDVALEVTRLQPNTRYTVDIDGRQADLVADGSGAARLTVRVVGRAEIVITPSR